MNDITTTTIPPSPEGTPGRSHLTPSGGGAAQRGDPGGTHKETPGRSQVSLTPSGGGAAQRGDPGGTLYWEDFPLHHVTDCGSTTVSRAAILDFARQFDPQPFHLDEEAAKHSLFGGLAASGWHTCAIAMRLMCDAYLLRTTSQGSPGIDELRWLKPVHPDDILSLRMTVLETRPMRSKPHLGLVQSHWELFNQHGDCVLTMKGWGMFKRRDVAAADAPQGQAAP